MKKFICLILAFVLMISVSVTPVFAMFSDDQVRIYRKNFTQKYIKPHDAADGYYFYFEQYYHYTDKTQQEIEWVLVYGGDMSYTKGKCALVMGDRVFFADEKSSPFVFKYAVYDVKEDKFYDLSQNLLVKYEGLEEALRIEKAGTPFGDADFDSKLTVIDSTIIQRAVARVGKFDRRDDISSFGSSVQYVSDFDKDGDRSVMDATGVQMAVAKMGVDPDDIM